MSVLASGGRLPALDGLRGVAVLMVMGFHFMNDPSLAKGAVAPLFTAAHVGQTGVDLFFVLSGFLITGILVDTKSLPHFFRNFYLRRTLRIFPLYYAVLFVLYVLLPFFHVRDWWPEWQEAARHQAWQWLYMTNVATFLGIPQLAGHFWTLAVEEHYYLLWPLVVFHSSPRVLSRVCVAVVAAALGVRAFLAWRGQDTFYLTPCRMDALAIGSWIAVRLRQHPPSSALRRAARGWVAWSAPLMAVVYLGASGSHSGLLQVVKFPVIGTFYGACLLWLVLAPGSSVAVRLAMHPALRFFGKYSYGLYVFHVFVLRLLPAWIDMRGLVLRTHSPVVGIGLWLLLATAASSVAAWLGWHVLERQFLKLKERLARYAYPTSSPR